MATPALHPCLPPSGQTMDDSRGGGGGAGWGVREGSYWNGLGVEIVAGSLLNASWLVCRGLKLHYMGLVRRRCVGGVVTATCAARRPPVPPPTTIFDVARVWFSATVVDIVGSTFTKE